jgi:hypothetical protein
MEAQMRQCIALAFGLLLFPVFCLHAQEKPIPGDPIGSIDEIARRWINPYGHCTALTIDTGKRYRLEPEGERARSGEARLDPDGTLRLEEPGSSNRILLRRKDAFALCGRTQFRRVFLFELYICFYNDRKC